MLLHYRHRPTKVTAAISSLFANLSSVRNTWFLVLLFVSSTHAFQNNNNPMRGAWKSQGKSQLDLVDQLFRANIVQTEAVRKVLQLVDRGNYYHRLDDDYSPRKDNRNCYTDCALSIGLGQTISAPHMHAYALEELYPTMSAAARKNDRPVKVLDVGCGSGYLTACFGRWMAKTDNNNDEQGTHGSSILGNFHEDSKVYGIDVRRDLVDMTRRNILRKDGDLLRTGIVDISLRDGWKGLPEEAPFDAIHVGAAAERLPEALATQLKVGGTLIIPIGPHDSDRAQVLYKIRRIQKTTPEFCEDDYEITSLLGVRYVPLVPGDQITN